MDAFSQLVAVKNGFLHIEHDDDHSPMVSRARKNTRLTRSVTWPEMPTLSNCSTELFEACSAVATTTGSAASSTVASSPEGRDATPHHDHDDHDASDDDEYHLPQPETVAMLLRTPSTKCPSPRSPSPASPRRMPSAAPPTFTAFAGLLVLPPVAPQGFFTAAAPVQPIAPKRRPNPVPFKALNLPAWAMEKAANAPYDDCEDKRSWYSPSPCSTPPASPRSPALPSSPLLSPFASPMPQSRQPVPPSPQVPTRSPAMPAAAPCNKILWSDFADETDDEGQSKVRWSDMAEESDDEDGCAGSLWLDLAAKKQSPKPSQRTRGCIFSMETVDTDTQEESQEGCDDDDDESDESDNEAFPVKKWKSDLGPRGAGCWYADQTSPFVDAACVQKAAGAMPVDDDVYAFDTDSEGCWEDSFIATPTTPLPGLFGLVR